MSRFNGKRSGVVDLPKQLRVDPELGAAVRFWASKRKRTIGTQILVWIEEGVERDEAGFSQIVSGEVSSAQPKSVAASVRQEKLA